MIYKNSTEAFSKELASLLKNGNTITVRGSETKEELARLISIKKPQERVYIIHERLNNIFATIAETMWVIAGRNDMEFLSRYLPRARDFSDDSITWRAGYGKRLFDWNGVNQIYEIYKLLKSDLESRRAVIQVFDPSVDFTPSKDIPCTNWLQFICRDNELHLNITIRSNDIVWGFSGINTFEWSVVQEIFAYWLDVKVGQLNYFVGSLHLYDKHYQRAEKIINSIKERTVYDFTFEHPRFSTPFDKFDNEVTTFFELESRMRSQSLEFENISQLSDPMFKSWAEMLFIYNQFLNNQPKEHIMVTLNKMHSSDLKVAATEFLSRKWKIDPTFVEDELISTYLQYLNTPFSSRISEDNILNMFSELHYKKSLVYKDSWKKRGEVLSIIPNISRKYDRLESLVKYGSKATGDESVLDTIGDLAIYAAKFITFLADTEGSFNQFLNRLEYSEDIYNYQTNTGYDSVISLLIMNRECSHLVLPSMTGTEEHFSEIKKIYNNLEELSLQSFEGRSNLNQEDLVTQKCLLAGKLFLICFRLFLETCKNNSILYERFERFVKEL